MDNLAISQSRTDGPDSVYKKLQVIRSNFILDNILRVDYESYWKILLGFNQFHILDKYLQSEYDDL